MAKPEKILEAGAKQKTKKVVKYTKSKKEEIRAAAYEALGSIHGEESVNALIAGLNDESVNVRIKVARSMQKVGSDRAAEFIKHRMEKETSAEVKDELKKALSADRNKEA